MRYIILFIIAILLPVFAFLNFGKKNIADFAFLERLPGNAVKFLSFEKNKTAALVQDSTDKRKAEVVPKVDDIAKYRIPAVQYSEPLNFPSPSYIRSPYFERLQNPNFLPIRNWDVQIENVDAAVALVLEPVTQKVLYHKDIFDERPIASLTKLMTAMIAIEEMNLSDEVLISKNAVGTEGEAGDLVVGEKITVQNLLTMLLVVSSNDAAIALEEYYNAFRAEQDMTFVAAMNRLAQELGLESTFFVEPTGLSVNNRSTAYDLARMADHVFQRPVLREILSTQIIDAHSSDGIITHHLVNSNKLLGVLEGVLAGKTGYTEEAGESLILYVKKSNQADDYLIYVVLGSSDRVKAARHLIDWVKRAYIWE